MRKIINDSKARITIGKRVAGTLQYITTMSPSDFVETLQVPAGNEVSPGKYSMDSYPWQRDILDCLQDTTIRQLAITCYAQGGKTFSLRGMLCYSMIYRPGGAMFVSSRREDSTNWARKHMRPFVLANDVLRNTLTNGTKSIKTNIIETINGSIIFDAGNSEAAASGKTVSTVYLDEIEKYSKIKGVASIRDLLSQRVKAYGHMGLVVAASTPKYCRLIDDPTGPGSELDDMVHDGDIREWYVPCKHCGDYYCYKWDLETHIYIPPQAYDAKKQIYDIPAAMEGARIKCPHCQGLHDDNDRLAQQLDKRAHWRPTKTASVPGSVSYCIRGPMGPKLANRISELVKRYCTAHNARKPQYRFWQDEWGAPYNPTNDVVVRTDYAAKVLPGASRGVIPLSSNGDCDWTDLIVSCDVQRGHVWWSIHAYVIDPTSSAVMRSHTIDAGRAVDLEVAEEELLSVYDGYRYACESVGKEAKQLSLYGIVDINYVGSHAGSHSRGSIVRWIHKQRQSQSQITWVGSDDTSALGKGDKYKYINVDCDTTKTLDKIRFARSLSNIVVIASSVWDCKTDAASHRDGGWSEREEHKWTVWDPKGDSGTFGLDAYMAQVYNEQIDHAAAKSSRNTHGLWVSKDGNNHCWDTYVYAYTYATALRDARRDMLRSGIVAQPKQYEYSRKAAR